MKLFNKSSKGFTLIELLIVIAVLGVMAAIVLVAINPAEILERGRDAGRVSSVTQLGHAIQTYMVNAGQSIKSDGSWNAADFQAVLKNSGDLGNTITQTTGSKCSNTTATGTSNNFCYNEVANGTTVDYVVWTDAMSKSFQEKCGSGTVYARITYSSVAGKTGVDCVAAGATNPAATDTLK